MRDKVYGVPEVTEKFSVEPGQLRDLLALMGDSSDNVPGVPSVGPKTAADLVKKFGTIEAMYERIHVADRAAPQLREALLANEADRARLAAAGHAEARRRHRDRSRGAPLCGPAGDQAVALRKLFSELESRAGRSDPGAAHGHAHLPRAPRAAGADGVRARGARRHRPDPNARLSVQVQASGERTADAALIGLGLAVEPGEASTSRSVIATSGRLRNPRSEPSARRSDAARRLRDPQGGPRPQAHDRGAEGRRHHAPGRDVDVLLASYCSTGGAERARVLARPSSDTRCRPTTRSRTRTRSGAVSSCRSTRSRSKRPPVRRRHGRRRRELAERLVPRIDGAGLDHLLRDVEIPLTSVLAEMELTGVLVDIPRLKQLSGELDAQLKSFEEQARGLLRAAARATRRCATSTSPRRSSSRPSSSIC